MRGIIREEECSLHGITLHLQYKQVRNLSLRVKPDGSVFVSVPLGVSKRELLRFLADKEDWLRDKVQLQTQRTQQKHYTMGELPYDGKHVWLWGKRLPAKFFIDKGKSGSYEISDDAVCFYYHKQLGGEGLCAFVERLYKEQTYNKGRELLLTWSKKMGVHPTGLKVRIMKTLWGSCNVRTGGVNLNALLACWPAECLELTVVHELTHLLEHNHTPRFYAIVGSFLHDWRKRERILREFYPMQ